MGATRPEKRIGSDELWDKAEAALMASLQSSGCEYTISPGDGAFYGPKVEYTLKDALGRQWQCGTMQVDFSMAERLGGVGEKVRQHERAFAFKQVARELFAVRNVLHEVQHVVADLEGLA